MSEKRNVPTFRIYRSHTEDVLEGPIVAPDRTSFAENLSAVHALLIHHQGMMVYAGEWVYLPHHAISEVRKGGRRFSLPWPL